jgi:hypothetical protein
MWGHHVLNLHFGTNFSFVHFSLSFHFADGSAFQPSLIRFKPHFASARCDRSNSCSLPSQEHCLLKGDMVADGMCFPTLQQSALSRCALMWLCLAAPRADCSPKSGAGESRAPGRSPRFGVGGGGMANNTLPRGPGQIHGQLFRPTSLVNFSQQPFWSILQDNQHLDKRRG